MAAREGLKVRLARNACDGEQTNIPGKNGASELVVTFCLLRRFTRSRRISLVPVGNSLAFLR